ncbi:MAG: oligosaccharide flippase family protein [Candidatus Marsarchaeota archaeon]|nr:oligosaccharide flippase family protein [Candidatus Marsarchaeota archaeon]
MGDLSHQDVEESALDIGTRAAHVTSYVLLSKLASFLSVGIAFILITRILGPADYGIYVLATGIAGIFGSVGNFGIATTLNRFIARYTSARERGRILSDGFFAMLLIGGSLTIIAFLASGLIAHLYAEGASFVPVFRLISFTIVLSMLFGAAYSALIGLGKGQHAALSIATEAVFQAVIGVGLALLGFGARAPVYGVIFGYFSGFILGFVLLFRNSVQLQIPSFRRMRNLFRFSVPLAVSNIFSAAVNNLALLVLGFVATTFVIGNFGIASRANYLFDIVLGSIGLSLLPTFTASLRNKATRSRTGEFYSYSVYMAFVFVAPMVFFIATFAKPFSYVAFSSRYSLAPLYIAITSVGLLIGIAGSYASTLFVSAGKVKQVMKYNAIIAAAELALMLLFVPLLKGIGLVILLFVVNPLLIDLLFISKSMRVFHVRLPWNKIGRIIAANIIVSAILYAVTLAFSSQYIPIVIFGIAGFIVLYPPMVSITGGLKKSDIELLRKVSSGMPVISAILSKLLSYSMFFVR